VALAVGVNLFLSHHNGLRADITSENLNSLSPRTIRLVRELHGNEDQKPIKIDAYVSPQVPAEYAAHKLNFLSTLNELSSLSGGTIVVDVHEVENFSDEATTAEKAYGIEPREVQTMDRGARKTDEIFMGAAFSSGLDRVVIPFIDKGIPIEYELVRSICTVADQERKTLGVLKTDVQLFGGFSMQGPTEESQLVTELKKQYEVEEVDASKPIKKRYDVLLAIQPSSLSPDAMTNFVEVVKSGQPTAVFEDPFPVTQPNVVGTSQPKRPQGGMMGMFGGGPPEPKGDISQLWKLLGIDMYGDEIVWQDFNPEPKLGTIFREWVFVDESLAEEGGTQPFDPDDPTSAGMRQLLFFWPGSFRPATTSSKLDFRKLAVTGANTGTVSYQDTEMMLRGGSPMGTRRNTTHEHYILAARVKGKITADSDLYLKDAENKPAAEANKDDAAAKPAADTTATEASNKTDGEAASAAGNKAEKKSNASNEDDALVGKEPEKTDIDVVLVADIDWIAPEIFRVREMGDNPDWVTDFKFQNVTFVLNILDVLAKDDRFVDLRKRTRSHRILTKVEDATEEFRRKSLDEQSQFIADARKQIEAAEDEFNKKIAELENRTDLDPRVKEQMLERERMRLRRVADVQIARLEQDRSRKVKQSERELAAHIRGVQDVYKLLAVVLPPIPPLLLAFFVFFHRRKAEQEGVDTRRLRYGRVQEETPAEVKH
jgi:ABC-2 type transport system permease protein